MPQLKIQLSDWVLESAPSQEYSHFAPDEFEAIDARIVERGAARVADVADYRSAISAYEEEFGAEVARILGRTDAPLDRYPDGPPSPWRVDWQAFLVGGPDADGAARDLGGNLVAAVLGAGERADPVVPPVFLAADDPPAAVARALRQDAVVHELWRKGVGTGESLLGSIGRWCSLVLDTETIGAAAHIGRALAELRAFGDRVEVARKVGLPGVEFSIPVDPPLHLLAGPPFYDNEDLAVRVIPAVADVVAAGGLQLPAEAEVQDEGSTVVLRNWRRTDDRDLQRLGRLFAQIKHAVRPPAAAEEEDLTGPDLGPYLDRLGCGTIVGAPACWRTSGDTVIGVRPVDYFRDGLRDERRVQVCAVLGAAGGEPVHPELAEMLTRRGTIAQWTDAGLVFIGFEVRRAGDDEALRPDLDGFVALATEVRLHMHRDGSVGEMLTADLLQAPAEDPDAVNDWIAALRTLPVRLEVDFERMRRRWYRERLIAEVRMHLEEDALDIARSLVASVEREDDRNQVRAALVVHLFGRDADAALDELERLEFGPARHEAVFAVLEAAAEAEALDTLERIFRRWLESDARRFDYESDCTPLLETVAGSLGLAAVHAGYPEETAPPVACDWLNFVFRRSPRSRHDLEWLGRLDALANDESALEDLHLDRLANLFVVLRRHDLPGRRAVIGVIRRKAEASPYRAYYEHMLGESLHSPPPGGGT